MILAFKKALSILKVQVVSHLKTEMRFTVMNP